METTSSPIHGRSLRSRCVHPTRHQTEQHGRSLARQSGADFVLLDWYGGVVLTRGGTQGRGAALVSAAGAILGLVFHSVFAAVGLSALLQQSATAFSVVKYAGAAYLIYSE